MKTINRVIGIILKTVMAVSSTGVLLISLIQIVSRFIAQLQIGWSTDLLRLCFIYAVFSGMAYCAKDNEHINLDVVLSALPKRKRTILEIVILAVVIAFCVFLVRYGYVYMVSGRRQAVSFTRMPMSIYYAAIPLSALIMAYYYVQLLVKKLRELFTKEVTDP